MIANAHGIYFMDNHLIVNTVSKTGVSSFVDASAMLIGIEDA